MRNIWYMVLILLILYPIPYSFAVDLPVVDMGQKQYPNLIFLPPSFLNKAPDSVVDINKKYSIDPETNEARNSTTEVKGRANYHLTAGYSFIGNEVISGGWNSFIIGGVELGGMSPIFFVGANISSMFGQIELYSQKIRYTYFEMFCEATATFTLVKHPQYSSLITFGIPLGVLISSYDLNYDPYRELDTFLGDGTIVGVNFFLEETIKFQSVFLTIVPGFYFLKMPEIKYEENVNAQYDLYEHVFTLPAEKIFTYYLGCKLSLPIEKDDALVLSYSFSYRPKSSVTDFPAIQIHTIGITASFNVKDKVTDLKPPVQQDEDSITL